MGGFAQSERRLAADNGTMNTRRGFVKGGAVMAGATWAAPTIVGLDPVAAATPSATCEVPIMSNGAVYLAAPPASLAEGGVLDSNDETYVFHEQGPVELLAPLAVNRVSAGSFNGSSNENATIPAGTMVCSYYVHADRLDDRGRLSGQMTFPSATILGLIYRNAQLSASAFLQNPSTAYSVGGTEGSDNLAMALAPNSTVAWDMRFGGHLDQIRVIVACP